MPKSDDIQGDVFDIDLIEAELPEEEDKTETETLVGRMLDEAINFRAEELDDQQAKATDYYHGRAFGNEEEGRSQVVSTDVRDTVKAIMPSLLRVFFGPERVVEFKPRGPEDDATAAQQTDYVNYIVTEDNDGFLVFHSAFKDALVRKMGVIKWWWEDRTKVESEEFTGLDEASLLLLSADEDIEVEVINALDAVLPEDKRFDAVVKRTHRDGRIHIEAIPNEEFVFSPGARDLESAPLVAHVREVPASELVAMGVPEDVVEEVKGRGREDGELRHARRFDESADEGEDEQDEATRPVRVADAYVWLDSDDDKIAELHKVIAVGDAWKIVEDVVVEERPFALFCPNPEPHTLVGLSTADDVMDIQLIKSAILRAQLDSLAEAIDPSTEVVEGMVNMQDVLSTERGRVIRTRKPGMLRERVVPFVGKEAFPMLQYMDEKKENSTGISKAAAGLDADALQSATKAAVAATISAAQQQIEMIARIFAETGMKQLFRGLLRTVVRHQDHERLIRLRNEYVVIDPRYWDANMDVIVNVALGQGMTEEKLQMLGMILQDQKEQLSMGSPLVSFVEYRNTLKRFVELAGWKNADEFYRPWGPQEQQQFEQMQSQQQQQADPTMMLVQLEQQKLMLQAQQAQAELQLKAQAEAMKDDRERDKMAREFALKEFELELKHQAEIEDANLKAKVAADRAAMDADIKREQVMQRMQQQSAG